VEFAMIDVQALNRTGRRQVLHGFIEQLRYAEDNVNLILRDAHQTIPGFTALMGRNVRVMRPAAAIEKTLQTLLAAPAKPKFRRADPQTNHSSVRFVGLDKLKF
jgi:hypothetical protein